MGAAAAVASKKSPRDIEQLLTWAVHELAVRGESDGAGGYVPWQSSSPMWRAVVVKVDNWARHEVIGARPPHPDALIVEAAILGLERYRYQVLAGPFGLADDIGLAVDETDAVRRALASLPNLIVGFAALGKRPAAGDDKPEPKRVIGSNGKPKILKQGTVRLPDRTKTGAAAFVEYETGVPSAPLRAGLYETGAYCPINWWPDPQAVIRERAEYAVWHAALRLLAEGLAGQLQSIAVLPPAAAARPWLGERDSGGPSPRIFRDLSAVFTKAEADLEAKRRRTGERRIRDPRGGPRDTLPRPVRSASVA